MNRILTALLALFVAVPAAAAPLRVLAYETRPFFYRVDGKPAGLEYEILEFYAKAKGQTLQVRFVEEFDQILPMIERGEGDVAAATLTVTPARRQRTDWSDSYFPVRVMLVEPKTQNTTALAQLAGQRLATMRGTTYESLLAAGVPRAQFVYADDEEALFRLVASGEARAAAADSAVALPALQRFPQLRMGMPLSEPQSLAFAVRKGSPLAAELSRHIQQLKASQIYFRLLEKHLGAEAARLVAAGRDR